MAKIPITRVRMAGRAVTSYALGGAAQVLSAAARATRRAADTVRPERARPQQRREAPRREAPRREPNDTGDQIVQTFEERGRVVEPPQVVAEGPARASKPESHIAELAEQSAGTVISAVKDLSTDELRMLLEYEQAHKRRKTVIAAIEQAAAAHIS